MKSATNFSASPKLRSGPDSSGPSRGRVGALAVTLGIGAALATGLVCAGTAAADASESGSSASHASAGSARSTGTSGASGKRSGLRTAKPAAASSSNTSSSNTSSSSTGTQDIASADLPSTPDSDTDSHSGNDPTAPAADPAAWTTLAASRRDLGRSRAQAAAAVTASSTAANSIAAAAVTPNTPSSLDSNPVGWVTGQNNSGIPGFNWPQTNNTAGFGIYGTDLGIMWENGLTGKIQLAFGDTFSGPNMTGTWRSNVLLLSTDTNLSNGLQLLQTGYANQFIPSAPGALFPFINSEVTIIPTSAVSVNDEQYVNYMSVKSWDTPGRWTTNYNAISMYDQATDKWVLVPSTIRSAGWFRSSTRFVPGSQNFQQAAYVLEPEDQVEPGGTQYLYAFGTPSGRAGSAYLSRVAADDLTDLSKYEYWDGSKWVENAAYAAPIIGDSTHSAGLLGPLIDWANDPNVFGGMLGGLFGAKTGGNVSEMSVQYNDYLDKYVVLYGNGANNVIMRTADTPEGPWSDPITLATSIQYPGLYAPMIHPWSGTGKLTDSHGDADISTLYWNMSLWGNYNVVLMETDLSPLVTT